MVDSGKEVRVVSRDSGADRIIIGVAAVNSGTISGTLLIGRRDAYVLFDTRLTYFVMSLLFVHHLGVAPSLLYPHMSIATPMGNSFIISNIYPECLIVVEDRNYKVNLLSMEMHDFDIILGMDWLSEHRATIDCQGKRVIFEDTDKPEFVYQGSQPKGDVKLIFALKVSKLLSKGCDGYLAFVKDTSKDEPRIKDYPVVREYEVVFPDELPGLPPHREVEFTIELVPDLERLGVEFYVRGSNGSIANLKVEPNLVSKVKEAQKNDTGLEAIRSEMEAHSSSFSIHPGSTKMYRDLKKHFWWSGMKGDIEEFMGKYLTCQQVKIDNQRPSGLLQQLDIPDWKETTLVHELVEIFRRDIVRLHGVPVSIVSDRDTRFTSRFWKGFQQTWGTRLNFSTAYHPQTDGQSERTIRTLDDMLRACALEWTGDWDKYLYLVEFAYNNSWHASIDMPPFEALYGRRCRSPSSWDEVGERVIEGPELVRITNDKVSPYKGVKRFGMKGKLTPRYVGPFDVMEKVGEVSYRVTLPPQLSYMHNVFHVSVLRDCKYQLLHVLHYPLHKIREDLSCEEEAEAILAREERVLRKNTISFVKVLWKNHSEREATWELKESICEKYPHLFD
ncbi:uncharacterized protein LOC141673986 [Apium graveolens]|uniref:uncharacterized protein LOC141673986 n=1 Tax=Apium graveolens TaxID=4045 RepID=UPI003D7B16CA